MDSLTRQFFELSFRLAFLERKADEFQGFFSDIMEKRYPGDFVRVRPWGSIGDRKNDGYLLSRRTLFAVYAPNELAATDCINKIDGDFCGALPYWIEHFDIWVFVHNARDGLGPTVLQKLLELRTAHPELTLNPWGYEELRQEAMQLPESELASLLGPAPSRQGLVSLGLAELAPVLDQIARLDPASTPDLRPVPADKLQYNQLSSHAAMLLTVGLSRADLVRQYFTRQPSLRDQVAETFRREYLRLRNLHNAPDEIVACLQRFTSGDLQPTPDRQCATLAVLAFFFEECDIFDRPEAAS